MDKENIESPLFPEIASEILLMAEKDQEMIGRAIENRNDIENTELKDLIKLHTDRMKNIIQEIGWPTISKVGLQASKMAWLLVQHADQDINFQKECLELMKSESATEVSPINIAYLEDRVRVNSNQPQIYGTQFHTKPGEEFGPFPIIDPEKINETRTSVGLGSIEEYSVDLKQRYKIT